MISKETSRRSRLRNNRIVLKTAAVLMTVAVLCLLTSCEFKPFKKSEKTGTGIKNLVTKTIGSSPLGDSDFNGPMDTWSSNDLRLSFKFPSEGRVVIDPDLNDDLRIEYTQDLTVGLFIRPAWASKPSEFKTVMEKELAKMPEYTGGFKKIKQAFFEIDGYPAAYLEYTWQVMRQDFHVHGLWIMKDNYQYEFAAQFLESKYDAVNPAAIAILKSIKIMDGPINTGILSKRYVKYGSKFDLQKFLHGSDSGPQAGKGAASSSGGNSNSGNNAGSQSSKTAQNMYDNVGPVLGISKDICKEKLIMNVIASEYGDKAKLADWEDLKRDIGDQLPLALMSAGLQDNQAAWVSRGGKEYFMGMRHYFVQRFDAGPPSSFWAHDKVGNIYLGSWYDITLPVLVVKKTPE